MGKYYIGMSLGFNSSACLVSDIDGVLAAVSQERLNGVKNTKEIPVRALIECCKIANVNVISGIAYSHYQTLTMDEFKKCMDPSFSDYLQEGETPLIDFFKKVLDDSGITLEANTIKRFEHHMCHYASALAVYGGSYEEHFAVTSDGFGDGISGRIIHVNSDRSFEVISEVSIENSVALVYQFVTGALGYKEHQHEGKITGLAAFGRDIYLKNFLDMYVNWDNGNGLQFDFDKGEKLTEEEEAGVEDSTIIGFRDFLALKKTVYKLVSDLRKDGAKQENIAASVQSFAELVTLCWISRSIKDNPFFSKRYLPVYLAGGLFANVKLNQKISDLQIFSEVLVSPAMGDEGTAMGSAFLSAFDFPHVPDASCKNMFLGTQMISADVKSYFYDLNLGDNYILTERQENEVDSIICSALANKKIVCLCEGAMEFGPRALCHRSILYDCSNKNVNSWLNDQLGRTEFMPFAPVCMEEDASDLFYMSKNAPGRRSADYMTMTFDCKMEFVEDYPAACHVDNTARPQIVSADSHMHRILTLYRRMTGKKVLINTSFNLHNNPIIGDAKTAIDSFVKSKTDMLVVNNIVIRKV